MILPSASIFNFWKEIQSLPQVKFRKLKNNSITLFFFHAKIEIDDDQGGFPPTQTREQAQCKMPLGRNWE